MLEIELVPSTSFFNNVRTAVTKKQWDIIRNAVYASAWYKCQICGGEGNKHPVECHEVWEYDDKLYIQKLIGMIALCPDCHATKHYGLSQLQGKEIYVFKHFIKINNISPKQGKIIIKKAFDLWKKRSKHNWTVDISLLSDTYGIQLSRMVIK